MFVKTVHSEKKQTMFSMIENRAGRSSAVPSTSSVIENLSRIRSVSREIKTIGKNKMDILELKKYNH